uniref:Cytochrome b5 heme-binding domain-containing protein n=1 Tax=Odontella aurita TaxID=265563 RepID=A0A7S4IXH1_9STRA|mmetsp:Transcript_31956/g.95691  ORF Transcript_31956/g.95691 Transcript_31956/m.95691 type:complete len:492 (+) Transcript_31956:161-1636(+)|eukprot:CAMPEP_0113550424 /NCGR_PEP_ID=MMETSP0015_2-20120614/13973_1 /TAXON_ID=2838 /ORGANISM="Odontella" /LENGTH=491 /DNA_ID=CAMNT_0000451227 /DNA_START=116 /DNA_END=1591 /DNA_ORIENTATION=- /assembly_acc=CAM_ASM_000160
MPPCKESVEGDYLLLDVPNVKTNATTASATATNKPLVKSYTVAEVASHNTKEDAWLIYKGKVLDVTKWIGSHPGGEQTILNFVGMDATDELRTFHDDWVLDTKVPNFVIGTVSDAPEITELVKDFRELGEEFEKVGYFHVSQWYYIRKLVEVFSVLALSLYLLLKMESFVAHMGSAVLMGIFWQQFAFVGHDCGHMSARTHARDNIDVTRLGALVTFCNGISVAWWKSTHNVHHAVPNSVDSDPDIAHLPVFALSKLMFASLFNKFHGRVMEFDWAARNIFVPYQHLWYYPIMCVARFNLYIQSVLFLLSWNSNDGHVRTKLDLAAFIGFYSWLSLLVSSIPTWGERVAFVLLSHAVAGLLNVQITLSHFSRPIFDSASTEVDGHDHKKYGGDFFTRNVISSLDVDCPAYLDWFHGGLQFQTLHHCYPRIGRQHLRKTMPLIESLCKKHSLPYTSRSFAECNMEVHETLKEAAFQSRSWSPLIYESMCAHG